MKKTAFNLDKLKTIISSDENNYTTLNVKEGAADVNKLAST